LGAAPRDSTHAKGRYYYSASDYRDILRRANELHIQVIPEIDMPGHMRAGIQSMRVRTARLESQGSTCVVPNANSKIISTFMHTF